MLAGGGFRSKDPSARFAISTLMKKDMMSYAIYASEAGSATSAKDFMLATIWANTE